MPDVVEKELVKADVREGETAPTEPIPVGPYGGGELVDIVIGGTPTKAELVTAGPLMVKVDGGAEVKANTGDYIVYYTNAAKTKTLAAVVVASFFAFIKGEPVGIGTHISPDEMTDEEKADAIKTYTTAAEAQFEYYRNTPASAVPPFLPTPPATPPTPPVVRAKAVQERQDPNIAGVKAITNQQKPGPAR